MKKKQKRRDLKIVWSSNAPFTPSGYGVFTKDFLRRLKEDGWPFICIAWAGLEAGFIEYDGYECWPKMQDPYGGDAIVHHTNRWGGDVVFTMQDVPTLDPQKLKQVKHWIPYLPIHYSPSSIHIRQRLNYAYKIITFAEYGRKGLADEGYSSTMIPEGIDTKVFRPLDKNDIRKKLNIHPDVFLWGMVGANKEVPTRKGFQEAMDAFKIFSDERPNLRTGLYIHTHTPPLGSFNIIEYAKLIGIENKIHFPSNYDYFYAGRGTRDAIVGVLNSFDCLLQPSRTEGFGLPIVEAQACGKPVIATDFSAMPELIVKNKTGLLCGSLKKDYSSQLGYWVVPDPKSLAKQMGKMYKMLKNDKNGEIAKAARDNVLTNFDIDVIFKEKWVPYLENLQEEILGPKDERSTT